ncbi:hypothetical protein [Streptacidiphilus sp. P02-A3a]|uniref:hypothetical protein n=1 Tax=Streptacidiphilus sp. P02-A3a TaxID=2704468 RepID=UPI0015FB13DC|nr:hypothetical protein [Streptacidiphilus sp. P02-A3a]QMU72023.1 hypothetical protein GXP74_31100 [Streptacidiphilus sp. P02-A3a]
MRRVGRGLLSLLGVVLALPGGVLAFAAGHLLFSPGFDNPGCGMCVFLHFAAVPSLVVGVALLVLGVVLFRLAALDREEDPEAVAGPLGEDP